MWRSLSLSLVLSAAGCIPMNRTMTPPPSVAGVGGKLIARQLDEHTWRIYWSDDTPTFEDGMTREDYFLYRAADLVLRNGFDWFSIQGQHVQMFKGVAPPDVLGTFDARQVMQYVGPRVLPGSSPITPASGAPPPSGTRDTT